MDALLEHRVHQWQSLDTAAVGTDNKDDSEATAAPLGSELSTPLELRSLLSALRSSDQATLALAELDAAFGKDIQFGTAGLRGKMGAGWARMNHLTVRAASQGLARFLEKTYNANGDNEKPIVVVVGFDGRYNSRRFAEIAAASFLSCGNFRVHLFRDLAATPLVSFGVKHAQAQAGVMVTASHNPKDDNGYKVYWGNSAQITSPIDVGIATEIARDENRRPWKSAGSESEVLRDASARGDLVYCDEEMRTAYMAEIAQKFCFHPEANAASTTQIVFTPMHGVGQPWVAAAFAAFRLPPFVSVPEQKDPDPEFSTVPFPNPEEGKGALALAMQAAEAAGSRVVIANDPDSDRLALAEKGQDDVWKIFSGNETAMLLVDYVWQHRKRRLTAGEDAKKIYVMCSTVSSLMLKRYAEVEGLSYEDTLTGFKWLGNRSDELVRSGNEVLFAFEEAIGFMIGDTCLDKDGVRAAAVCAEMAVQLYEHSSTSFNPSASADDIVSHTFTEHLLALAKRYGVFVSNSRYFFCYEPATMDTIFTKIRGAGSYPSSLTVNGSTINITRVRDCTATALHPRGFDSATDDKIPALPVSSSTHMITFWFDNGAVITLRGSGTEPKLKYYTEMSDLTATRSKDELQEELDALVQSCINEFLEPKANGLVPPRD